MAVQISETMRAMLTEEELTDLRARMEEQERVFMRRIAEERMRHIWREQEERIWQQSRMLGGQQQMYQLANQQNHPYQQDPREIRYDPRQVQYNPGNFWGLDERPPFAAAVIARSEALLRKHLNQEQQKQYDRRKWFVVFGAEDRYAITSESVINITVVGRDGFSKAKLCSGFSDKLPAADVMLSQKLAIETDEAAFLSIAHIHGTYPMKMLDPIPENQLEAVGLRLKKFFW